MPRIRWILCLVGLSLQASAASAQADLSTQRADWQADFEQLKIALEQRDPNLAWLGSPQSGVDLPVLYRKTSKRLAEAHSEDEAAEIIDHFVKSLRDGHLSQLTRLAPSQGLAPEPEKPELDPDDPVTGCAVLGFSSSSRVGFSLPFSSLRGFRLLTDGQSSPFQTAIMDMPEGGHIAILRIERFRPAAFPSVCLEAWTDLQDKGGPLGWDDLRQAAQTRWLDDLAARLRTLQQGGARALIIDVGDNPGGNDTGDWVARMLTNKEVSSSRLYVSTSADGVAYLDEVLSDLAEALKDAGNSVDQTALRQTVDLFTTRKAAAVKTHCDLSWVWTEQRPWDPAACNNIVAAGFASGPLANFPADVSEKPAQALFWPSRVAATQGAWTGPVYVLTDHKTYSSAEMFTAIVQDNGIARILGQRTGGDGCGFMSDPTPLQLTHLKMRFRIPNCLRLRKDGTNEIAGISPDIAILPTEAESPAARAARTLEAIRADLAQRTMER